MVVESVRRVDQQSVQRESVIVEVGGEAEKVGGGGHMRRVDVERRDARLADDRAPGEMLQRIAPQTSPTMEGAAAPLLKSTRRHPPIHPCGEDRGRNPGLCKFVETCKDAKRAFGPSVRGERRER